MKGMPLMCNDTLYAYHTLDAYPNVIRFDQV